MVRSLAAVSLTVGAGLALSAAGVGAGAPARTTSEPPPSTSEAASAPSADGIDLTLLRLREGTRLADDLGHFRLNGDVLTFIQDDGRELVGLANLNLERVLRMLKSVDEPESVMWSVNGTVTEFSGRNYLLVTRAVYKAATPSPPMPCPGGAWWSSAARWRLGMNPSGRKRIIATRITPKIRKLNWDGLGRSSLIAAKRCPR